MTTSTTPSTPSTAAAQPQRAPRCSRALILVDVQPTFCEGGELAVDGGNQVAADIADFVRAQRGLYDLLVTTQDWHVDPGTHFSASPDFVDTWPVHAVAGSEQAQVHPAVAAAIAQTTGPLEQVRKGEYAAAYSGFEGVDADGTSLAVLLDRHGITDVDVAGIAESHCVAATVLDAREGRLGVRLLTDLTVPVTAELGAAARRRMLQAGATALLSSNAFPATVTGMTGVTGVTGGAR